MLPQEVVVQGPPNFNIFHGESPPPLVEADLPTEHTLIKLMEGQSIETAEFNTKKLGKFGGRLAGLSTLSKPCRCPQPG